MDSENSSTTIQFVDGISAGFPNQAADYIECPIDLNKQIIKHPSSTFLDRVRGVSMKDAGIDDMDFVVIDKSLDAFNNSIAVCYVDGEFTLKQLSIKKDGIWLIPANKEYKPIKIKEESNFLVWGE